MRNRVGLLCGLTVLLFIATCFCTVWQGEAIAQTHKDLILLVDVSTSMADIFEQVQTEAKEFIETARPGDRVILVTLGENARLLDRRTIKYSEDIEELKAAIDALSPTELSSYLALGLDKALEEMREAFRTRPDHQRILLWLSDEKDNPPSWLQDMLTFDQLIQKSRQFDAGENWFRYDAPLSEVDNPYVDTFFRVATLPVFNIYVSPTDLNLGSLPHDATVATFSLLVDPESLDSSGARILVEVEMRSSDRLSRRPDVSVSPAAISVSPLASEEVLTLSFSARPGPYEGSILLRAGGGERLTIKPSRIPFRLTVSKPPAMGEKATPAVAMTYEEPTGPRTELELRRKYLEEAGPAGVPAPTHGIVFRDIGPGREISKAVVFTADRPIDAGSIRMIPDVELPAGLEISSDIREEGDGFRAEISLRASPDLSLSEGWLKVGSIRFLSTDPDITLAPATFPVELHGASMQVARVETEPALVLLRRWLAPYIPRVSMAALALFLLFVVVLLLRSYAPRRRLLTGRLEVVKDPTGGRIKNINLQRASRLRYKGTLTVGSSRRCDIVLQHQSVAELHCRISAKETEQGAMIFIQPAAYQHVKVNDDVQTGRRQVFDRDLVQIGDFVFVYRSPAMYRETLVRYMDGRSLRGIPITWDIGAPGFRLLLQGPDKTNETRYINFADLKAVYFLQKPGQEGAKGGGRGWPHGMLKGNEVEVFFKDGESIEGYTLRDYSDTSKRFFLIPREPGNIISALVERQNVESLYMRSTFSQEYPSFVARVTGFFRGLVR